MDKNIIGVIGLGYVGLPLAIEFSKKYKTYGFDINTKRVDELNNDDITEEADYTELINQIKNDLVLTSDLQKLANCNIYIITVPTPITQFKTPDLFYLISASEAIGSILRKDVVIYESTVYPGCTEEICVPVLKSILD